MRFKLVITTLAALLVCGASYAEKVSNEETTKKEPLKEKTIETMHTVDINGQAVSYKAIAGTLVLKDEKDKEKDKGSFFYVAYIKEGEKDLSSRPITYCFNGGPGSAAIWLHLGAFGPRKVELSDNQRISPPYNLEDNKYSILDVTDLVFIDPISTGYSKPATGEDPKQFHGVDEDIKSVAEFVRMFTTKFQRWESPKFIAGESYGTTRAVGLAAELHDEYFMYINGIVLVSSVLDFQTIGNVDNGNDLPYILMLPTYSAAAFYQDKLDRDLQKNFQKTIREAKDFAINEYSLALLKGDSLDREERDRMIAKLHYYTGLPKAYLDDANLRVGPFQFRKELLSNEKRIIGRFDSRYKGYMTNPLAEYATGDPSAEAVFGMFTATFNHYIQSELEWKESSRYSVLTNVFPWNFGKATNEYLNLSKSLSQVMSNNPQIHVMVANGYYDLATPFFATEYTFNHLNIDKSLRKNITMTYYEAGHMMYIHQPSLVKLNDDIRVFIKSSLPKK
ncbi:MAG: peptidase S10 [Chlamydiota bacterium]|nr:peptidase S10 [Chlamydiota bacterium]